MPTEALSAEGLTAAWEELLPSVPVERLKDSLTLNFPVREGVTDSLADVPTLVAFAFRLDVGIDAAGMKDPVSNSITSSLPGSPWVLGRLWGSLCLV